MVGHLTQYGPIRFLYPQEFEIGRRWTGSVNWRNQVSKTLKSESESSSWPEWSSVSQHYGRAEIISVQRKAQQCRLCCLWKVVIPRFSLSLSIWLTVFNLLPFASFSPKIIFSSKITWLGFFLKKQNSPIFHFQAVICCLPGSHNAYRWYLLQHYPARAKQLSKFNDLPKVLSFKPELDLKPGFLYHLTKWNLLQIWSFLYTSDQKLLSLGNKYCFQIIFPKFIGTRFLTKIIF